MRSPNKLGIRDKNYPGREDHPSVPCNLESPCNGGILHQLQDAPSTQGSSKKHHLAEVLKKEDSPAEYSEEIQRAEGIQRKPHDPDLMGLDTSRHTI